MSDKLYDFSEIEAALNAELDEADALILERWREHLKKSPVTGSVPELVDMPVPADSEDDS